MKEGLSGTKLTESNFTNIVKREKGGYEGDNVVQFGDLHGDGDGYGWRYKKGSNAKALKRIVEERASASLI